MVNRGLEQDGMTMIGSIDEPAWVDYRLLVDGVGANGAVLGQDFRGQGGLSSGKLAFAAGQTTASLNIEIIDDIEPELEETFKVY